MQRDAEVTRLFQQACGLDVWSKQALEKAFDIPGTYLWDTQNSFLFFRHLQDEVEVFGLGTLPVFQRQGHASTLINRLKTLCLEGEIQKIFLEVSATNKAAARFYGKQKFQEISRRRHYYGAHTAFPGDAMILCWER